MPKGTLLLRHALAANDVLIAFLESAKHRPGHELLDWHADWEATHRFGFGLIAPDLYLVYATATEELHAFVEMDRGTAPSKAFAKKIERYLSLFREGSWTDELPVWPTVLTVTLTEARARLLKRTAETVLARMPELADGTEFAFAVLPQVVAQGPLAAIWSIARKTGTDALLGAETTTRTGGRR